MAAFSKAKNFFSSLLPHRTRYNPIMINAAPMILYTQNHNKQKKHIPSEKKKLKIYTRSSVINSVRSPVPSAAVV